MSLHGTADGIASIEVRATVIDPMVMVRVWERGDEQVADLRLTVAQAENLIQGLRFAVDRIVSDADQSRRDDDRATARRRRPVIADSTRPWRIG